MATVEVSFTPLPAHVRTARLVATAVARRSGVAEALLDEVRLAVGEACSRAVEAHRLHCPAEPVRIALTSQAGRFEVEVTDTGPAARGPAAGGPTAGGPGAGPGLFWGGVGVGFEIVTPKHDGPRLAVAPSLAVTTSVTQYWPFWVKVEAGGVNVDCGPSWVTVWPFALSKVHR